MHRRRHIIGGIAAAGVVLFAMTASVAWADAGSSCRKGAGHVWGARTAHHGVHHGMSRLGGAPRHLVHHLISHQQEIGLTDEQVTTLRTLSLNQDRARIRARAELQIAQRELQELGRDEKTELSAIEAKMKERESLKTGLRMMRIKDTRDLYAVLTLEQRDKQKAILERRRSHHGRQSAEKAMPQPETGPGTGSPHQLSP